MKGMLVVLLSIIASATAFSQGYKEVRLTREDRNEGTVAHYQCDATDGHYRVCRNEYCYAL